MFEGGGAKELGTIAGSATAAVWEGGLYRKLEDEEGLKNCQIALILLVIGWPNPLGPSRKGLSLIHVYACICLSFHTLRHQRLRHQGSSGQFSRSLRAAPEATCLSFAAFTLSLLPSACDSFPFLRLFLFRHPELWCGLKRDECQEFW